MKDSDLLDAQMHARILIENPGDAIVIRRLRRVPFQLLWDMTKNRSAAFRIAVLRAEVRYRLQNRFYRTQSTLLAEAYLFLIRLLVWRGDCGMSRQELYEVRQVLQEGAQNRSRMNR